MKLNGHNRMDQRKLYKRILQHRLESAKTEVQRNMSNNPEKTVVDDTKEEKEDSDEQWSDDDEYEMREIVLGLPALSITRRIFGDSSSVEQEEEEARLNEQAVAAAELIIAAAEEAVMKGKNDDGGSGGKKKSRPRKLTKTDDEADGSGKGEATKKPKKKASELTHPPKGPPVCNICGKGFGSWKAVFGHMRAHKDRNYQGFLPPPTFSAAAERFTIPGQNSAFVLVTSRGGSSVGSSGGEGSSGGFAAGGDGGAPGGESGRGLGIDLNVDPVEVVEEATESASVAKFDLNKSPPKDEEEEEKAK